jgi:hypothetical protein
LSTGGTGTRSEDEKEKDTKIPAKTSNHGSTPGRIQRVYVEEQGVYRLEKPGAPNQDPQPWKGPARVERIRQGRQANFNRLAEGIHSWQL